MTKPYGFLSACLLAAAAAAHASQVSLVTVEGVIGPATATYLTRAIEQAEANGDECLLIELDTPGGVLDSTKTIVQAFLGSTVPTVVYVAPSGAHAGSAGCFITLAADVAAMAPATAIGAAHPVAAGGGEIDPTMQKKLENFYGSYIESIATKRGRNARWARSSVRESATITADEALKLHVIDLIAKDRAELLERLDGRVVNGKTLHTAGATVTPIAMSLRERVFRVIAHPQMMLVFTLLVIYGIIGELTTPGATLPGVLAAIALVLLLYLASVLPMNVAGLVLIAVAMALFLIDVFAPTHGILTAGGVVAFFLGALMLFDRSDPFLRLSLAWIIPATAVTALFFVVVVGAGLRAQRLPVQSGVDTMRGKTAQATTGIDAGGGKIFVEGEYWNAVSPVPVAAGATVRIVGIEGLTLHVQPVDGEKEEHTVLSLLDLVPWATTLIVLAVVLLPQMVRVLREYERGVIFRLGKLLGAKGPGLVFLIPVVDRMVKMDLRVVTIDVPKQEVMTRDNVPVTVDAVVYFRVVDPAAAVVKVENFLKATSLIAQTTLRSVLGQAELDELLAQREKINQRLQEIIDRQTDPWGIKVTTVETKDVVLPDGMKRAMAKQAEAERERRAKIVNAEGEYQAAEKMVQAAAMMAEQPIALQLRYLQTMREIASEHNTTTFFPMPSELFAPFLKR